MTVAVQATTAYCRNHRMIREIVEVTGTEFEHPSAATVRGYGVRVAAVLACGDRVTVVMSRDNLEETRRKLRK